MITKIWRTRYLALCLTLAFLAGAAQVVIPTARAEEQMGQGVALGYCISRRWREE